MSYVRLPPTVSKIQATNRYQREYLQQCKQQLEKYQQWCPQLAEPLAELCQIIGALSHDIDIQDELIKQRIQLQAALIHPELSSAKARIPPNATSFTRIPENIWLPSLEENKTHDRIKHAPYLRRSNADTFVISNCHQHPSKTFHSTTQRSSASGTCNPTRTNKSSPNTVVGNVKSHIVPRREATHTTTPELHSRPPKAERLGQSHRINARQPWSAIPSHLKAFPSLLEQLIKLRNPVTTPTEWNNRFAPLFDEYYCDSDPTAVLENTVKMTPTQATEESVGVHMTDDENILDPPVRPPSLPEANSEPVVTMDMLRHL